MNQPMRITLISVMVLLGLTLTINLPQFTPSGDFRNNLWVPTYLLVRGETPYQLQPDIDPAWLDGVERGWLRPVWFPMVIGALFPLGWLTQVQATNLWILATVAAIFVIIGLSTNRIVCRDPRRLSLLLVAVFTFPVTVAHLYLGQFSILVMLLFLLATHLIINGRLFLAAILTLIALSKPQLGLLMLPGLLIATLRQHGLPATVRLIGYFGAGLAILLIPLFLADFGWLTDFIEMQQGNPSWRQPSLFYILTSSFGNFGLALWALLALSIFGLNGWLWYTQAPHKAVLWSLALTLLISPYIWTWDFILLLPLVTEAVFRQGWLSRLTIGGFLVTWGGILLIGRNFGDPLYWWIPWLMVSLIACGHYSTRSDHNSAETPASP